MQQYGYTILYLHKVCYESKPCVLATKKKKERRMKGRKEGKRRERKKMVTMWNDGFLK